MSHPLTPVMEDLLGRAIAVARRVSRQQNLEVDPRLEALTRELFLQQGGCCAITRLPFEAGTGGRRAPRVPVLDRIDPGVCYLKGNLRLVWAHVALARAGFGDGALRALALAIIDAGTIKVTPLPEPVMQLPLEPEPEQMQLFG